MNEDMVISVLKKNGIEFVASLPCDRNKRLTALLPSAFRVIQLAREEDGVGICAGLALSGKRAAVSIQSSGLGNMLNALMSLTALYHLPLPILASWRGVQNEPICAQVPFNKPLPALLDVYGIPYRVFSDAKDLEGLDEIVSMAFEKSMPAVALLLPSCWGGEAAPAISYPPRRFARLTLSLPAADEPVIRRADAIAAAVSAVPASALIVSNIGVPSKELYAAADRPGNFYMLGSYMQASAVGLGCALGCPGREVYVIDGDGSLLGSAVLPVVGAEATANLHILALDNGTFGSTGNQISPAYAGADIGLLAMAAGIAGVVRVRTAGEIAEAVSAGAAFVHAVILPGNSGAANILLTPEEIKRRFMAEAARDVR
ncbi:MAG: sulfopyruvate decarboxylase subunit alpha [Methanocorpusculum sp.]|nr:sulfopyruvate decarboxylase subunit alpha [Methanocorpusculum sp.]